MLIEARNLTYCYAQGGNGSRPALVDISFSLQAGDCLGVIGGPGAGKTTLALAVAGITIPTGGKLVVGGYEATGKRSARRGIIEQVGYVPQWPERQLFARTVAEDVATGLGRSRMTKYERRVRVDEAMRKSGLDPEKIRDRPVLALSGAESRKAAIAGVVVLGRTIIIYDEPTAGLDAASRRDVLDLISRTKQEGRTQMVISHRLSDLTPVANKLLVLHEGMCHYTGGLEEAMTDEHLMKSGLMIWPPLIDVMLRLRRRFPEMTALVNDPAHACEEIMQYVGVRGRE